MGDSNSVPSKPPTHLKNPRLLIPQGLDALGDTFRFLCIFQGVSSRRNMPQSRPAAETGSKQPRGKESSIFDINYVALANVLQYLAGEQHFATCHTWGVGSGLQGGAWGARGHDMVLREEVELDNNTPLGLRVSLVAVRFHGDLVSTGTHKWAQHGSVSDYSKQANVEGTLLLWKQNPDTNSGIHEIKVVFNLEPLKGGQPSIAVRGTKVLRGEGGTGVFGRWIAPGMEDVIRDRNSSLVHYYNDSLPPQGK